MELIERRRALIAAQPRLPWEFQEAEYLQSSGTQYIVTNILYDTQNINKISCVCKFDAKSAEHTMFGCQNNKSPWVPLYFRWHWNGSNYFQLNFAGGGTDVVPGDLNFHTVEYSHNASTAIFALDGSVIESSDAYVLMRNNWKIALFCINIANSYNQKCRGKIKSFMLNDGALLNLVPCYRRSDSKPGMYDLCGSICPLTNSPFYINAGSGEFLVGPDVN